MRRGQCEPGHEKSVAAAVRIQGRRRHSRKSPSHRVFCVRSRIEVFLYHRRLSVVVSVRVTVWFPEILTAATGVLGILWEAGPRQ